jgi:hypothetical protein
LTKSCASDTDPGLVDRLTDAQNVLISLIADLEANPCEIDIPDPIPIATEISPAAADREHSGGNG